MLIAIVGDRQARHILHHQVRLALWGRPGVEHLGDGRMVHDGKGLALGLKTLHDRLIVHAGLDQLDGHLPPYRRELLGQPHLTHPAFSELAHQLEALRKDLAGRQCTGRLDLDDLPL